MPNNNNGNKNIQNNLQQALMDIAIAAVLAGGKDIKCLFDDSLGNLNLGYQGIESGGELKTIKNRQSESDMLSILLESQFKHDSYNVKRSQQIKGESFREWFIDGLDGFTNVPIRLKEVTCGLLVREGGVVVLAVALDPFEEFLYTAQKDDGAYIYNLDFTSKEFVISSKPRQIKVDDGKNKNIDKLYMLIDASMKPQVKNRKTRWMVDCASLAYHARMIGSNIKQGLMIANGRGHISLTDDIGGFYDLTGYFIAKEAGAFVGNLKKEFPNPQDHVVFCATNQDLFESVHQITEKYYGE